MLNDLQVSVARDDEGLSIWSVDWTIPGRKWPTFSDAHFNTAPDITILAEKITEVAQELAEHGAAEIRPIASHRWGLFLGFEADIDIEKAQSLANRGVISWV